VKRNVEVEILYERLENYLSQEREETLTSALRRLIEDPLRPRTKNGGFRLNPILLLLIVLTALSAGTFLYFSLGGL
jgi:hypothetical protein